MLPRWLGKAEVLFPSPRNAHREVFLHEVFVPHPYALIVDLPSFHLKGKYSLFAAYRLAGEKHGQLVSFEFEGDADRFREWSRRWKRWSKSRRATTISWFGCGSRPRA